MKDILNELEIERMKLYRLLDNPKSSMENIIKQSKILDTLITKVQKKNLSFSSHPKDKS